MHCWTDGKGDAGNEHGMGRESKRNNGRSYTRKGMDQEKVGEIRKMGGMAGSLKERGMTPGRSKMGRMDTRTRGHLQNTR